MTDYVRMIAIGGVLGALFAGSLAAPAVFGAAPNVPIKVWPATTISDLFPPPFDPKTLRKYDVTFDDSVSKEINHQSTVTKIGFGKKTIVTITTTPSGTYSSDGLASPNIRYPGVEVSNKRRHNSGGGSFFSSYTTKYGTFTASGFSSGSFTYYNSSFAPARKNKR